MIKIFSELSATEWQSVYKYTKDCIKESIETSCEPEWYKECSLSDYKEGFLTDLYDIEDNKVGEGLDVISMKVIIDDEESFEKLFNEARDEAYKECNDNQ